jgi:hypothetical protein
MLQAHSALRVLFRRNLGRAIFATAAWLLTGNAVWAADETFVSRDNVTLPGGQHITSFDISFVDPVIGLYLLADRTNKTIDVIETDTNTVFQLTATPPFAGATPSNDNAGPDGVITVNHREIWAGDGPSQVKVIDLFDGGKTTHVINTGGVNRADELCFDPRDQLVMMANDAESPFPFVTLISTGTYTVLQTIVMNGKVGPGGGLATPAATNGIEQCQWDRRTGNFYVNIPEVNGPGNDTQPGAVVVISPKAETLGKVLDVFSIPLGKCAGPQGMAIGPDHQILLGCNDPNKTVPSTVIIDDRNGKVIETVANQDGSDEVWYNEGNGQYFLARSGGANPQKLGIIDVDSDPSPSDQDVAIGLPSTTATPHGTNHSVAADPLFNQIYVPIAGTSGATICSLSGGSDTQGCIAIFTSRGPDDPAIPLISKK